MITGAIGVPEAAFKKLLNELSSVANLLCICSLLQSSGDLASHDVLLVVSCVGIDIMCRVSRR